MSDLEDTKPKAPDGLHEAIAAHLEETGPHHPVMPPPMTMPPYPLIEEESGGLLRWLPVVSVMLLATCMCLSIIVLSGFAGIRDELNAIGTQDMGTRQAAVATQYFLANQEIATGEYELPAQRLEYIATLMPGYRDSAQLLQQVREKIAYTPTSTNSLAPSITPSRTPDFQETTPRPTAIGSDPEAIFGQAQAAMEVALYEEAIRWLDALRVIAPDYRQQEVRELLLQALVAQGQIDLRGANEDGEDRLAQGVQLIDRAIALGYNGELVFEKDFVERYLAARAYIEGGAYDQAYPILAVLCEQNCDWAYQGVSVRDLFQKVGGVLN